MAKWLFTDASAATASWPVPPLGIHIEPTVLAAGRACSAFVLLLVALADRQAAGPRDRTPRRSVLRRLRRRRPRDGPLHVLQDHLAHERRHRDPARVPGSGHRPRGRRRLPRPQVHVGASRGRRALGRRVRARRRRARRRGAGRLHRRASGGASPRRGSSPRTRSWGRTLRAATARTRRSCGASASHRCSGSCVLGPAAVLGVFADPATAWAVLFMAVVSTVVPFAAFLTALKYIAPTNATVTSTVEPFLAAIGAFLLFGESLTVDADARRRCSSSSRSSSCSCRTSARRASLPPQD